MLKKAISLLLVLNMFFLLGCEMESEDNSIWAKNQLPYDYPLDAYLVLGEYSGMADVNIELSYEFSARLNAKMASLFPELVVWKETDMVERGDYVTVSCRSYIDGQECDFLNSERLEFVTDGQTALGILKDTYTEAIAVDALQDSINGEFTFTVPSFYEDPRYCGQKITLKSELLSVKRADLSKITDEEVQKKGEYKSVEELCDELEIEIYSEDKEIIDYAKKRIMWDKAVSETTFFSPLSETEIQRCKDEYVQYYQELARLNGCSYSDYLKAIGLTREEIMVNAEQYAENKVKNELVAFAIAAEQNLKPTREIFEKTAHKLALKLGYSGYDQMLEYNSEESIYIYVIWETAANYILQNAAK